jgi:aquaporin Z
MKKLFAELFGTFWLVFGGCGSAIFAASHPELGIGFLGVALAFGLTVLPMCFSLGHISGGHFNPAVTLGVWASGRLNIKSVFSYVIAQIFGALMAACMLFIVVSEKADFVDVGSFASNGYGNLSPGGYSLVAVLITEFFLTGFFVLIILGSTAKAAHKKFAPLAIGLALTLIHLISIPISNTSVNPARSTSQALFAGGQYIDQLFVFWIAPLIGGLVGGLIYKAVFSSKSCLTEF